MILKKFSLFDYLIALSSETQAFLFIKEKDLRKGSKFNGNDKAQEIISLYNCDREHTSSKNCNLNNVTIKKPEMDYMLSKKNIDFFVKPKINGNLKFRKKIYEFYNAPITKFWGNVMIYIIFLYSFTYMILVKTPKLPNAWEIIVLTYIFTFGIDKFREVYFTVQNSEMFNG
jgi:hypothetical protein